MIGKTTAILDPVELPVLYTSKPLVVYFGSEIELKTFHKTAKWCHDTTGTVDSIKFKGGFLVLAMDWDALNSKSAMLPRTN